MATSKLVLTVALQSCRFQVVSIPTNDDGSQDTLLGLSLVSPHRSCCRLGHRVLLYAVSCSTIDALFFLLNMRGTFQASFDEGGRSSRFRASKGPNHSRVATFIGSGSHMRFTKKYVLALFAG